MVFPVKVPYTVTADMSKYSGQVFNPTPDPAYLIQKKLELNRYEMDLTAVAPEAGFLVKRLAEFADLPPTDDIRQLALLL
jgi:hypothetical protein